MLPTMKVSPSGAELVNRLTFTVLVFSGLAGTTYLGPRAALSAHVSISDELVMASARSPGDQNTDANKEKSKRTSSVQSPDLAQRWRFDLSGNSQEHAAKLAASGLLLGFFDTDNRFLVVKDLSKRPVETRVENV